MKRAFTYKDLSVIAGIAVALIIVFTLWVKQTPQRPSQNMIHKASFSISDLKAALIDRTLAEVIG
jgi:hypothetical protein